MDLNRCKGLSVGGLNDSVLVDGNRGATDIESNNRDGSGLGNLGLNNSEKPSPITLLIDLFKSCCEIFCNKNLSWEECFRSIGKVLLAKLSDFLLS